MKNIIKLTTLSLVTATAIYAGGYKIPEVSTNGAALSAANVACSHGADAAYYNPANMIFMEDENNIEVDTMFIKLDPVHFQGSGAMADVSIDAESEFFIIPSTNFVSAKLGEARVGFSMVVPAGLTKRWNTSPARDKAQEFTLTVIELNPTVAIPINDKLAVAFGFRAVYSEGIVKSSSIASRDMVGDSIDFGYNLALSYRPTENLKFGLTYRSKISLSEEGNAKLFIGNATVYDGGASVSVPLPASLNVAMAYTFPTKTTVEFAYERNFWSAYSTLDFNYVSAIPNILVQPMDDPITKGWKDTNAYRLGITQELDKLTLMAGVVIDESPVPDATLSFELPDSDSLSVSFGTRYQLTDSINLGFSALYSMRESRSVSNDDITGEFSNSNVLIISAGLGYKF
ncbi:MAG: aromatic hydrocarbon degradation protein [Epsilonproteobacteria bacterium]|nr:aromatic hydrocarbon degradation protein [Campylobacterota bacterium]